MFSYEYCKVFKKNYFEEVFYRIFQDSSFSLRWQISEMNCYWLTFLGFLNYLWLFICSYLVHILTCPNPGWKEKINLNFYFDTSLWGLQKTFWKIGLIILTFRNLLILKCSFSINIRASLVSAYLWSNKKKYCDDLSAVETDYS